MRHEVWKMNITALSIGIRLICTQRIVVGRFVGGPYGRNDGYRLAYEPKLRLLWMLMGLKYVY